VPHPCCFRKGAGFDFSVKHRPELIHLLLQVVALVLRRPLHLSALSLAVPRSAARPSCLASFVEMFFLALYFRPISFPVIHLNLYFGRFEWLPQ
jgi:hypothetical protein